MTQGYSTPPYAQPPGGKSASPLGIAALVIGIVALLISWVPLCGMAAIPVAAVGFILGIIGFVIANNGKTGKGLPLAGSILCIVAIGVQVLVTGGLMVMGNRAQKQLAAQAANATTLHADPGYTISDDPTADDIDIVLAAEVKKAAALKRKPFVEFYADWCGPCKQLAKALKDNDPQMTDAFAGTYIIRLNSDTWSNQLAGTGMKANTIPVFYELTQAGKATGRHIDGGAWEDNTPSNMAPPLKAFFLGKDGDQKDGKDR